MHNIIKRFRETGEISVRKGQGRRPLLDAHGLRALRRHCITHLSLTLLNGPRNTSRKPLSVNTIRCAICVLQAKEEGDLPAFYQHSVQKPASLMVWGAYGMGSLHVLEGTMNAERYIKVLEQHMLLSRWRLFQQEMLGFVAEEHGFVAEESGCWIGLPAVQIFHL